MTSVLPSIASLYHICIKSFSQLYDLLQVPGCEFSGEVSLLALENELGRFRIWAGNVGAHRDGRVSLDYKLREAPEVHEEVSELLKELEDALREDSAIAIVSHERKPFDQLSWSPGSSVSSLEMDIYPEGEGSREGESLTTELQERFLEVAHVITCLYRFSIAIRNPVPRDRLEKCASIIISHYEPFDIQHTSHKFPNAAAHLIDRLGKANSRRRQLFKYHEKHHDKLTRYIDLPEHGDAPAVVDAKVGQNDKKSPQEVSGRDQGLKDCLHVRKGPGTIATTVNTQTTVSTYVKGPSDMIEVSSDAGHSQTSYATSASGDTGSKLRVPPPPNSDKTLDGEPFECPYCFSIITVNSSKTWMKHVFRDLRPYVCTFKDCPKPGRLFDSRHDWYDHEVEAHRREWFCNACHQPFSSKNSFENHLRKNHLGLFTKSQLPTIIDRCERAIEDTDQECPLCGDRFPPRGLKTHLARHMQQLALFTLPKMSVEANDRGSAGAQASEPDEEEAENSLLGSADLELSSVGSSKTILDSISSSQNEIPETENETWRLLTDPGYESIERNSTVRANDSNEGVYSTVEDLEAQTMGKMKTHPDSSDTLTSMENLAAAYIDHGRYKEAEDLRIQVWGTKRTTLGTEHPDTLSAMTALASTYYYQGRWKEAEDLELQVVEGRKKVMGRDHPDTLSAMTALASIYYHQGRWKEAEDLELQVVEGRKKVMGRDHPDTLSAMAALAPTYSNQGRWKEAEDLELQVIGGRKKVLGEDHPDTLSAMAALASTYSNQGRWKEAEYLELQVIGGRKKVLGEDHPNTLSAMAALASIYSNQGRWKEAEDLELQVVEGRKKVLGEDHPNTLSAMTALAWTYSDQGSYKEAEALQLKVVECRGKVLGEEHPETLLAMTILASTYSNQGRYNEAEVLELQAIEGRKKVLGEDHPSTLSAMAALASMYSHQERYNEAEVLELQVLEGRKKVLGEDHPSTLSAMTALALTYSHQGRYNEAEVLQLQEIEGMKKVLGGDHPSTLSAMTALASTYSHQGLFKEAEKLREMIKAITRGPLIAPAALKIPLEAESGYAALRHAVQSGNEIAVDEILRSRAGAGTTTHMLMLRAARQGDKDVVELLLKKGMDTTVVDEDGYTALYLAAKHGHVEVVKTLLGSRAAVTGTQNYDPLQVAVQNGHEQVVEILLGSEMGFMGISKSTALHYAAHQGDKDVVEVLLRKGVDVTSVGKDGNTALHLAASAGYEQVAEVLLRNGAEIEAQNKEAYTALHFAAQHGREKTVEILLKNGANIEAHDEDAWTALQFAVIYGHEKVVEVLQKYQA